MIHPKSLRDAKDLSCFKSKTIKDLFLTALLLFHEMHLDMELVGL